MDLSDASDEEFSNKNDSNGDSDSQIDSDGESEGFSSEDDSPLALLARPTRPTPVPGPTHVRDMKWRSKV